MSPFTCSPTDSSSSKSMSSSMQEFWNSAFKSCAVFTSDSVGGATTASGWAE